MAERRRLRPDLRRQQILEAAVRIFYEQGYEAASLRDLAERVGINKATVYHYFESKEDILYHIVDRVGGELLEGVREAFEAGGPPLEMLERMIRFQIGYMEHHVEEIKVLVEEKKSLRPDLYKHVRRTEAEILRLYKEVLERCVRAGRVRPVHITTAAFGILGQINWFYHWYRPDGALTIGQLADEVVGQLFHGLLPRGAG